MAAVAPSSIGLAPGLSKADPVQQPKAPNKFFEILRHPWENRKYVTGTVGGACLVAGVVCLLAGVWIGKVAIIALIGLTLLGYAVKNQADESKKNLENAKGACNQILSSIPSKSFEHQKEIDEAIEQITKTVKAAKPVLDRQNPDLVIFLEKDMLRIDAVKSSPALFNAWCGEFTERILFTLKQL